MSYQREVTLFCDGCSVWERYEVWSVGLARRAASDEGWKHVRAKWVKSKDGKREMRFPPKDFCPRCADR
jgi:hypothetical protein